MKIVSNASPLIGLVRIGKLDLLRQLYNDLIIPDAVWREVVVEGAGQPGADDVQAAGSRQNILNFLNDPENVRRFCHSLNGTIFLVDVVRGMR